MGAPHRYRQVVGHHQKRLPVRLLHQHPVQGHRTGNAKGYTKFRAYAVLNHDGDMSAAARALMAVITVINPSDVPPMPDPDPIPLTDRAEIPPFPVDSLPKPIADMVKAVAEATQTDPAMAGTSALSALSACTGGHAEIEIRQGWQEPLNIYTATIADPGERKSAVQLSMVRPIHDVERAARRKRCSASVLKPNP